MFSIWEGAVDLQTVANATGTTTRVLRDPYEAPLDGFNGVWSSGTGYMNKPVTASTGLTTVGARTYDPVLGKFLSVDPVIDTNLPQQNTGYTYSGNNPTTYMDPTGLRLDQGCGWGVNCTRGGKKNVNKPNPWTGVGPFTDKKTNTTNKPQGTFKPQSSVKPPSLISTLTQKPPANNWVPKAQPAWGPLIGFVPNYQPPKPTVSAGFTLCAVIVCYSRDWALDGSSGSNSITFGPRVEVTLNVSAEVSSPAGAYLVAGCSASGVAGAGAEVGVGIGDGGLAGSTSGTVRVGAGGGCTAGIRWSD